jgi:hypothetical protein
VGSYLCIRERVLDMGRIAAEGLDGPHVAQIFGIEKVDGRWQPVSN